jgi:hypothetical protein
MDPAAWIHNTVKKALLSKVKVHTSSHTHSSVSSLPAALSTFLPAATTSLPRGEADLKITLIWSQGRLFYSL